MKTYQVEVTRTVTQMAHVQVDAEDEDSAIEEAESAAWNIDDSDWEITIGNNDFETGKVTVLEDDEEDSEEEKETV